MPLPSTSVSPNIFLSLFLPIAQWSSWRNIITSCTEQGHPTLCCYTFVAVFNKLISNNHNKWTSPLHFQMLSRIPRKLKKSNKKESSKSCLHYIISLEHFQANFMYKYSLIYTCNTYMYICIHPYSCSHTPAHIHIYIYTWNVCILSFELLCDYLFIISVGGVCQMKRIPMTKRFLYFSFFFFILFSILLFYILNSFSVIIVWDLKNALPDFERF